MMDPRQHARRLLRHLAPARRIGRQFNRRPFDVFRHNAGQTQQFTSLIQQKGRWNRDALLMQ